MEIRPDSFTKNFIKRYYRVIFLSGLPEAMMFLAMFASGLTYRTVLVLALLGPLRALRLFLEARGWKDRAKWRFVMMAWSFMLMFALALDFKHGPLFPEYSGLPVLEGVIAVVAVFILSVLFFGKAVRLAQRLSGNAVFKVCPACGYSSVRIVDRCDNCGFTDGVPLPEPVRQTEPPEDIRNEIEEYRRVGLLKKIPDEAVVGLNLSPDEHILMAVKGMKFEGARKDGGCRLPGWFFMTTRRIAYYRGIAGGWLERDFIPYEEITGVDIIKDKFAIELQYALQIDSKKGSWEFFFGSSWQKYFRRIYRSGRLTNEPTLREILACLERRRKHASAQTFDFDLPASFPELPPPFLGTPQDNLEPVRTIGKPGAFYLGSFFLAPMVFLFLYISGLGWRFSLLFSMAGRLHRPLEFLYLLVPVFGAWLAFRGYSSALQKKVDKSLATLLLVIFLVFNVLYALLIAATVMH